VVLSLSASTIVNSLIERLCKGHDTFRGGSANMILFSSVGHSHDRVDPAGLSDRVGALVGRVRPPRLPARGAGDCASPSEVNRSWSGGTSGLSGKPYPCNDEFETGGHLQVL
jgi:hypothetical protein